MKKTKAPLSNAARKAARKQFPKKPQPWHQFSHEDLRKQEDDRSREHWAFVEATANKVGNWPSWKQAAALTAIQTERQEAKK